MSTAPVLLLILFGVGYSWAGESLGDGHCVGIDPAKREDCGYYGIKRHECEVTRGCCYDNRIKGIPWCFKGKKDLADKCRSVQVNERNDCGWIGIDKVTCEKRGCCWDDKGYNMGSKYCFYPKGNKCYGINPNNRRDCGYFGIQRDECENKKGCCFDHTVPGVPWCFHGKRPKTPPPPPLEGSA